MPTIVFKDKFSLKFGNFDVWSYPTLMDMVEGSTRARIVWVVDLNSVID